MYARLPKLEFIFYFFYWLALFGYAIYQFYLYCRVLEKNKPFIDWALIPGFIPFFKYREKFDSDITVMYKMGLTFAGVCVCQIVIKKIIFGLIISKSMKFRDQAVLIYIIFSGAFGLYYINGFNASLLLLVLTVSNWILIGTVFKKLPILNKCSPLVRAWLLAIAQTFLIHKSQDKIEFYFPLKSADAMLTFLWGVGWYNLRLVSFFDFNEKYNTGFLHFLGYVHYFPTFYSPFVLYPRFLRGHDLDFENMDQALTRQDYINEYGVGVSRVKLFLQQLVVITIWIVTTVVANHAFFPLALAFYPAAYKEASINVLAGHAWFLGQWFQAKYMLLYGFPWLLTFLDTGVPLPDIPVFISRIYRYSVMWRKFDTGLYEFMKFHLFGPSLKAINYLGFAKKSPIMQKLVALTITYTFVGIWHGLSAHVLMFAAMNFFGLLMEFAGAAIGHKLDLKQKLSPLNYRRLVAFSCLWGVQWSWWSFFFFTTDWDRGMTMIKTMYFTQSLFVYVLAYFAIYCWVHISMELELLLDLAPKQRKEVEGKSDEQAKIKSEKKKTN